MRRFDKLFGLGIGEDRCPICGKSKSPSISCPYCSGVVAARYVISRWWEQIEEGTFLTMFGLILTGIVISVVSVIAKICNIAIMVIIGFSMICFGLLIPPNSDSIVFEKREYMQTGSGWIPTGTVERQWGTAGPRGLRDTMGSILFSIGFGLMTGCCLLYVL